MVDNDRQRLRFLPFSKQDDMSKERFDETDIADAIMGVPRASFEVEGKRYSLYPLTLGKALYLARFYRDLELNAAMMKEDKVSAYLMAAFSHKETACRIIAIHCADGAEEATGEAVETMTRLFVDKMDTADIAKFLCLVENEGDPAEYIKYLKIDEDDEWRKKAIKAKSGKGTLVFGGKSIYGTMIDNACQRYGWSFDYVVWGISLLNLRLLLADSITTIYLSEEEMKRARIPEDRTYLKAEDPRVREMLMANKWD